MKAEDNNQIGRTAQQEMAMRSIKGARGRDKGMTTLFYIVGGVFLALAIAFTAYIIINGIRSYFPGIFQPGPNGIGNQIFNTVYMVFLALIASCLIGIPAGIYMAEYAKDNKWTRFIRISIEALSSLPSIVVGLFGYLVFVLYTGMGWTLLGGALTISILSIPLITTTTEDALRVLPKDYLQGSLALGSTHWYAIRHVLMPAAMPRIMTGVIMAAGRAFGEATALMYTAGMSTFINWSSWNPTVKGSPLNPMRPGETLALHIWTLRSESINPKATEIANFSAAILVIMVFFFSILARAIAQHIRAKNAGEK